LEELRKPSKYLGSITGLPDKTQNWELQNIKKICQFMLLHKNKGKPSTVHSTKAYRSRNIDPLTLIIDTRQRKVVNCMPRLLQLVERII